MLSVKVRPRGPDQTLITGGQRIFASLNNYVHPTTVLNETWQKSNYFTCDAGKDFTDSYQHVLRYLPPYGQICCIVDNVA